MSLYRGFSLSFVFWRCAGFQIFLPAVRRLRGALLFHGSRALSIRGFPFWLLGLTLRSSRPAFCGWLTLAVRRQISTLVELDRVYLIEYTVRHEYVPPL